jgi:predicted phage terminase large subunit-like protein
LSELDRQALLKELLRRRRCQESLLHYALYTDIPGVPAAPRPDPDLVDLLGGPEAMLAPHHALLLEKMQECMETPYGRLMIMMPPGSAKSSYASVLGPSWHLGRFPGEPLILTSYAGELAEKHSTRAQQICASEDWRLLWDEEPVLTKEAARNWVLSNNSTMFAAGLLAGITGQRAAGAIIDDPVAGREEADSPTVSKKTWQAFRDDLLTRLKPEAWLMLILTRWHELDLAGRLLPEDYDGRTGPVKCTDGLIWYVINIPAKAERPDDPLGREPGTYLWPEYFTPRHWQQFENATGSDAQRTWSSLFQQRPTPDGAGEFRRDMFNRYKPNELPPRLNLLGASDFAVTKDGGDFTESGLWGVDSDGNLWAIDWWYGQETTDISIKKTIALAQSKGCRLWYNEGGVIDKAVRPAFNRAMREQRYVMDLRSVPSMQDKVAKCKSFQAYAAAGMVYLPHGQVWAERLIEQLVSLPAGRYDDAADVAGLIGRVVDQVSYASVPAEPERRGIVPFSAEWLEHEEEPKRPAIRYRA